MRQNESLLFGLTLKNAKAWVLIDRCKCFSLKIKCLMFLFFINWISILLLFAVPTFLALHHSGVKALHWHHEQAFCCQKTKKNSLPSLETKHSVVSHKIIYREKVGEGPSRGKLKIIDSGKWGTKCYWTNESPDIYFPLLLLTFCIWLSSNEASDVWLDTPVKLSNGSS